MALPRQETERKLLPTNWMPLGQIPTHIHKKWVMLVVYKRAMHPAKLRK